VVDRTYGFDCPKCSRGKFEREFAELIKKSSVNFDVQKRFPGCRSIRELPFDLYFPDLNILAELDGGQHFGIVYYFSSNGSDFKKQQLHDSIKNKFACDENKHMFRLSFSEKHNMEKHWTEFLQLVKDAGDGPNRPRIERFYGKEYTQVTQIE